MPEILCIGERKLTPNKKGTLKIVFDKDGRKMAQAICASCGEKKSTYLPKKKKK